MLFVNTNLGELWEVSLNDSTQTLVASGGSRGDLVSYDTSNNTAILSQTDSMLRLSLPAGFSFSTSTTNVPEPGILALMGFGLLGLARVRRITSR